MDVSGLTVKADRPDGSLLTVDGSEQMVGKLRSLRSGLWEGHRRTCVDKPTVNTVTLILPSRATIKQMFSFTLKLYIITLGLQNMSNINSIRSFFAKILCTLSHHILIRSHILIKNRSPYSILNINSGKLLTNMFANTTD